jgi:tellurite resistance protein TehA-like permease
VIPGRAMVFDTNILGALAALVVAIGGGLAFIAYKHPREYAYVFWCVFGIYVTLSVSAIQYDNEYDKIYRLILNSNLLDTAPKIEQFATIMKTASTPWWWQDMLFVGLLYVVILRFLVFIPEVRQRWEPPVVSNKTDKIED